MKLFNRYSGYSLANLCELLGSLTVVRVAEIDKGTHEEISEQLDWIKDRIERDTNHDEFIIILVRQ